MQKKGQIHRKRKFYKEGFRGGPAYYMEQGLKNRTMGIVFSILITICFGFIFNAVQSNTITAAFNNAFGMDRLVLGLILATLTGIIIFGGVHRVAKVSEVSRVSYSTANC